MNRLTKILTALAITFGCLAVSAPPADAAPSYNTWRTDVIYIQDTTSHLKGKDGRERWPVREAARLWGHSSPLHFVYGTSPCTHRSQCVVVKEVTMPRTTTGTASTTWWSDGTIAVWTTGRGLPRSGWRAGGARRSTTARDRRPRVTSSVTSSVLPTGTTQPATGTSPAWSAAPARRTTGPRRPTTDS